MRLVYFICISLFFCSSQAQSVLDSTLSLLNNKTVPYTYTKDVSPNTDIVLLDTREKNEFNVSHLKNAIWVGYSTFKKRKISKLLPNKNTPIIVYCSIGVRSEDIGEKLLSMGYTNVKNLYGGIFEWKNSGFPLYDLNHKETDKIHAYDKVWGKLLKKGHKIYK